MATESRFWGDVPYVIPFPPRDSMPTIVSELAEKGLAKETVSFLSGDRFTMTMGKQGPEVEGHVNFGRTAKESDLRATVKEMIEGGHLVAREIHGKLSGELNYHLYRRLDYLYTPAGLLDTIRFGSWYYDGASDREKKPGAWVRHAIGEIVLVREEGRLTRIETSIREGRRSLRGEPEYADPVVKVETIRRTASGAIDRLVTTAK
jgi:hypothetical protein